MTTISRTRLNPEQRKQQLLQAAIEVFARRGIGRAAHADIASATKVSVPTVFNYFKTREDLVDAVLSHVESEIIQFAERHHSHPWRDPMETLLEFSYEFLDLAQEKPNLIKIWLEWSASVRDDVWPRYLSFKEQIVDIVEPTIQRGLDQGIFNSSLGGRSLTRMLLAQAQPVTLAHFTPEPPPSDVVEFVQICANTMLGVERK